LDYGSFHDDSEHHSKAKHKDEEDHFELVNEECEVDASDQPA